MDSVWDLARVMRCPGTVNRKKEYGDPRKVRLVKFDLDIRHDADGLEVFIPTDAVPPASASKLSLDGYKFTISSDAEPPGVKIAELCALDAEFQRTWERKRSPDDLPSQSEYDLSLATRCADMGWTDQEIVNTLIAHRRAHGQPEKLRHDYYATRLAIVRKQNPDISEGLERLTEIGTDIRGGAHIADERRVEIKDDLTKLLALPVGGEIQRIEKYDGDPPTYALLTASGRITIGSVAQITNANAFRNAIASATGYLIRRYKAPTWDKVAQAVLHAAELIDLGAEVTVTGEVGAWLSSYLEDEPPDVGIVEGCESRVPFTHNGRVYVILQSMRSFLRMTLDVRIDARDLARRLRQCGSTNSKVTYRCSGSSNRTSSRSVYIVPTACVSEARGITAVEAPKDGE